MKIYVLAVVVIELLHFEADGEKVCSCYTFENGTHPSHPFPEFSWPQAKGTCKHNNKHLVVLETEREWEFINQEIQTRNGATYNEWLIGLYRNKTTGNWTWINGKPLTIDKWQKGKPTDNDSYTLIAKEYPPGHEGSFNSITINVQREWICEEETDNCQGVCLFHNLMPINSTPPGTTTSTTQKKPEDSTKTTTVPEVSGKLGDDDNSSTIVIIAASLASVLFVVLVVLAVLLFLYIRRRQRRQKDAESSKKISSNQQTQLAEYDSINPVEAAKLLGTPDRSKACRDDKRKNGDESPAVNCEYAVVNKADTKRKAGDLVYAQLAGFGGENDDAKPQKPPSHEPTVYADVVPPEVQTTGV